MLVSSAVARMLKLEGVEFISCYPAHHLIDACAAEGIRPIVARSERVVVNIADGFSRVAGRGRIGVCAMQEGAGVENAFGGVAQAFADSVPILVFPGHAARERQHVPPNFSAVDNFRGVTKLAAQINLPSRAPDLLRRAFTTLRTGRAGPVLLELPDDVATATIDENELDYVPVRGYRTTADPADVKRAADMLLAAKRPLVLAGQGVHAAEAWDELRHLVELLRLPVMTSMGGKGAFPENHALSLGVGALTATGMVDHFLRRADLIFAVGSSLTRWWMFAPLPKGCPIIQATVDERDLSKDAPIEHAVLGDAKLVLGAMAAEVERRLRRASPASSDRSKQIAAVKEQWLREWMPRLTSDEVPLNPYRVIWELMRTVDRPRTVVTHDSGSPRDQLAPFYEAVTPRGYVGWGHSTQLGYSLGLAMGMKLALPDHVVVNVMGDAAFGMVGMDLETASRTKIGILTILLNNSAMGGYEAHMPLAVERFSAKKLSGEYAKVADGLGAWVERVVRPQEIGPAIQRGLEVTARGRPALIEMITCEEPLLSRFW
jgi:thiamine pyrophosphate-dependent acetolactate synthase large subunit-like protein